MNSKQSYGGAGCGQGQSPWMGGLEDLSWGGCLSFTQNSESVRYASGGEKICPRISVSVNLPD